MVCVTNFFLQTSTGVRSRPVTRGGSETHLKKFSPPLEKCVGDNFKNVGPSQKTLRLPWCPKVVTVLVRRGAGI